MLLFALRRQLKKDHLASFSVLRYLTTKNGLGPLSSNIYDDRSVCLHIQSSQPQGTCGYKTCRNLSLSACLNGRGQGRSGQTYMFQYGSKARPVVTSVDSDGLDRMLEGEQLSDHRVDVHTGLLNYERHSKELFQDDEQSVARESLCDNDGDEEYKFSRNRSESMEMYSIRHSEELFPDGRQSVDGEKLYDNDDDDADELSRIHSEDTKRHSRKHRRRAGVLTEKIPHEEHGNGANFYGDEDLVRPYAGTEKHSNNESEGIDNNSMSPQSWRIDTCDNDRSKELKRNQRNRSLAAGRSDPYIEPYKANFQGNTVDTLNQRRLYRIHYELEQTQPNELARLKAGKVDLSQVITRCPKPKENIFLPIIQDSPKLQQLVHFGINLSVMQKAGLDDFAMRLNFERDILPYALCLKDTGLADDKIAEVFNAWPYILKEPLHNVQVRINYLRWKKFPDTAIVEMMLEDPRFLCTPFKDIDKKLGFIQQLFQLSGAEIRQTGGRLGQVLKTSEEQFQITKKYLSMLEFSEDELRKIFIKNPRVYNNSVEKISYRYEYVSSIMEVPRSLMAEFPEVLTRSIVTLRERHRYLLRCGRAQYDPTKPNYVALGALVNMDDETFCSEVAKTSLEEFDAFLRMI